MGLSQMSPMYAAAAKCLQDTQALGVGLGFDGEVVNATVFLRSKPGMMHGIGPAIVPVAAIGAAVLFPVYARSREAAKVSTCMSNMHELAIATIMYTDVNNGKLPTSAKWTTQIKDYLKVPLMACPSGGAVYAFNKNLSGLKLGNIQNPAEVVLFFEAKPGLPNASGSRADAILPHNGAKVIPHRCVIAFADGHVKLFSSAPDQSHWVPKYAAPKPVKKTPARPKRAR
jgi:prepilin-type processing-associated H-X9-DG protein